jgi:4-amino-4-deoxy-L-arabinose transferase-like glycosyltransferase
MSTRRERTWLGGLLALALAARVVFVTLVDVRETFSGGDGPFYLSVAQNLANGYGFVYGQLATYRTEPVLTAGPLYPAYLAAFYIALGGYETNPIKDPPVPFTGSDPWILGARLGQAVIGTLTVAGVYWLARRLWGPKAGLVAGGIMALDLRFIVETGGIYTETFYTWLLVTALALYVTAHQRSSTRWYLAAWAVLALAALARPTVLVVFPALALHLWVSRPRSQAVKQTAVLVGMLTLVAGPWLVRHYVLYGNFNILGSSAASHFWLGAIRDGQWEGLEDFIEQRLALETDDPNNPPYLRVALAVIAENPGRFAELAARKLLRAYLQPAGTVFFVGPSLKEMVGDVLAGRGSVLSLAVDPTFWPKLAIYVWHFGAIGLGLAAMWRTRRRWRDTLPLVLTIGVISGTYALLTIIPRYIFPIMPLFTVFAAEAILGLWPVKAPADVRTQAVSLNQVGTRPDDQTFRQIL